MGLTRFPLEIWRYILVYAVASRGLRRGLRLQLVCKLFAADVDDAIFKSGVLSDMCQFEYRRSSDKFRHRFRFPYLQRLALGWPLDSAPDWIRAISEVSNRLVPTQGSQSQKTRRYYIGALCKILDPGILPYCLSSAHGNLLRTKINDYESDVFIASIHLNLFQIFENMIDSIFEQWSTPLDLTGILFSSPLVVAANSNRTKMLEILLDRVLTSPILSGNFEGFWQSCLSNSIQAGHREIVALLLNDRWGPISVSVERGIPYLRTRWCCQTLDDALVTPDLEIFQKVLDYRQKTSLRGPFDVRALKYIIRRNAASDNRETVKWILETYMRDSWPFDVRVDVSRAMTEACSRRHTEMLCILLPYALESERRIRASVSEAAAVGNLEMVKLPLEQGNSMDEPKDPFPHPIISAILLEDSRMFQFLRQYGSKLDRTEISRVVGRAKLEGLDSMLELLVAEGIDVNQSQLITETDNYLLASIKRARCKACL